MAAMPEPIVLRPSWRQVKRNLARNYNWRLAIGGFVVGVGSSAVLISSHKPIDHVLLPVVTVVVVIVAATAAYNFLGLLARIEVTDTELKFFKPLTARVLPRSRIAGMDCADVIGLLPHVMRFAILHDRRHHSVLTLDRRFWSDDSLRSLEKALGLPATLATDAISFRKFRRKWRS
jgi:hypothetical protein